MNISGNTKVIGLEKIGCTRMHINSCLNDRTRVKSIEHTYFGARTSRGLIYLHTCKGDYAFKFDEINGWIKTLELIGA